eukprot:TRINITY_DN1524_c0_g1_i2.p1 TRINITY_DN1524_c0_g1~~TRINITY_DN1524_c0_g1_i2.p1  ORF type:complete len:566 (+),score=141.65 TRINITY_DN1524_c0_g1_i2:44-1741(+)
MSQEAPAPAASAASEHISASSYNTLDEFHALLRDPATKGVKSIALDLKVLKEKTYSLLLECGRDSIEELQISGTFNEYEAVQDPYARNEERKEKNSQHNRALCEGLLDLGFFLPRFRALKTLKFFFLAFTDINPFLDKALFPLGWLAALHQLTRLEFHRCFNVHTMLTHDAPLDPANDETSTTITVPPPMPPMLSHLVIKYSDEAIYDLLVRPAVSKQNHPLALTHLEIVSITANDDLWTKLVEVVLPTLPQLTTMQISLPTQMIRLLPSMAHLTDLSLLARPLADTMITSRTNVPTPLTRRRTHKDSPTLVFSHPHPQSPHPSKASSSDNNNNNNNNNNTSETPEKEGEESLTMFADDREAKREMEMSLLPLAHFPKLRTLHIEGFGRIQKQNLEALARLPELEHLSMTTTAGWTEEAAALIVPTLKSFKPKILRTGPRILLFDSPINAQLIPAMTRKIFGYCQFMATSDADVAFDCMLDAKCDYALIGLDLPAEQGPQLIRRIRDYEKENNLPRLQIIGNVASKWEPEAGKEPDLDLILPLPPTLYEICASINLALSRMSRFS